MRYVVILSTKMDGEVTSYYSRNFESMDEALVYFHDIDLKQEFSLEYMFSGGTAKGMVLDKSMFDVEETLIEYDCYDYAKYKGGE